MRGLPCFYARYLNPIRARIGSLMQRTTSASSISCQSLHTHCTTRLAGSVFADLGRARQSGAAVRCRPWWVRFGLARLRRGARQWVLPLELKNVCSLVMSTPPVAVVVVVVVLVAVVSRVVTVTGLEAESGIRVDTKKAARHQHGPGLHLFRSSPRTAGIRNPTPSPSTGSAAVRPPRE
jgi:hypothetical protein